MVVLRLEQVEVTVVEGALRTPMLDLSWTAYHPAMIGTMFHLAIDRVLRESILPSYADLRCSLNEDKERPVGTCVRQDGAETKGWREKVESCQKRRYL